MRRTTAVAVSVALVSIVGLTGCSSSRPTADTSPIPTNSPTPGTPVLCGAVPRRAVQLALGTADFSVGTDGDLRTMRSQQTVYCRITGSSDQILLDIDYQRVPAAQNANLLTQHRGKPGFPALPGDIGTGYYQSPWSKSSPSAQSNLVNGPSWLQITLRKGPSARDQAKDVVALTRLVAPYFPS